MRVKRLMERSSALLLARRRLFSEDKSCVLGFLQMVYRFVNFFNGFFKFFAGKAVIARKFIFKFIQIIFKIGNINVLRFNNA